MLNAWGNSVSPERLSSSMLAILPLIHLIDPRKARDTILQPIRMVRIQLVIQLPAMPPREVLL